MSATTIMEEPESRNWSEGDFHPNAQPRPALRCDHEITEYLGSGGSLVYRRCRECGDVVLVQAGRTIAVPGA